MRNLNALFATLLLSSSAIAAILEATVQTPTGQAVESAAVVLEPLSVNVNKRNAERATIAQRDREFSPYVTVVQTGTAIDFPNHDAIKHHIYSFSPAKVFEIKLYDGKPGQPVTFDKPGEVALGCNIHDWMEGHILIVNSPYFATTGNDGKAAILKVPAGRYRLQLWHPRQKTSTAAREIEIGSHATKLKLVLDIKPRDIKPRSLPAADHY